MTLYIDSIYILYMTESDFRFYHCYERFNSVVCHTVENAYILPTKENTRLLFVPKYVPKIFDTLVLNYKYYNSVKIIQ